MPDYTDLTYALAGIGRRNNPFDTRRRTGYSLFQQGTSGEPVEHPFQAASQLAKSLVGGWLAGEANRDEQAATTARSNEIERISGIADPQERLAAYSKLDPAIGMRYGAQLAAEQSKLQQQQALLDKGAAGFGQAYGAPQQQAQGDAGAGIAAIESGGRYDAVGPVANAKGNRAYGKYQVMDFNVGPWTQEVLGKAMTLQEFLANPQAQEAVFKTKFGQYAQKYGPEGAARAWFAGEGGMNNPNASDVNGMTVARYGARFMGGQQALPQQQTPTPVQPQPQAMPGQPPAPSASAVTGPAMVAPAIPDVPKPTPTQQQIQVYQQRLRSGEFGFGADAIPKARAALDAELNQQWQVNRERARMGFEQQQGDYKASRDREAAAPQKAFDNAEKLRDNFRTEPVVKNYREVVPIIESAQEAMTRPSRAADLNLVYALAKIMDPGSVVREGEMVMVLNTGTIGDRIVNMIGSLNGGQMLTPETRQRVVAEMQSRFRGLQASYDTVSDVYTGIAQRGGLKPEDVVIPIRGNNELRKPDNQAGDLQPGAVEDGYRFKGGDPTKRENWEPAQ